MPESADQIMRNERLVRCEVMLNTQGAQITQQSAQIKEMDTKLDGVVEYVNTRRGAVRVAERIGTFIMMMCAATIASVISWLRQK